MEGQDSERNELNRISELEEYFEAVELVNDPRFGEIIILVNKYNPDELIFAKEKVSHSLADCERDAVQAQERMQLSHDFLLKMIDFSVKSAESESPDEQPTFLVTGFYEYPKHDLSIEILERQSQGRHFTGDELMQLEINVLEVLTYLKSSKMIHGDIRPKYIYYDTTDQGWHKLVDRLGDPSPPNQAQIHNIRKKETLYISPELYAGLIQKQSKVKHNPYKSDAFSLGLVLLECGTLKSVQGIYKESSIDINVLLELIEDFMAIYEDHTLLKETLLWLLDTNEKDRKDPKKVLSIIKEMLQEAEAQANEEWEGNQGEEGEIEAEDEANEISEQVENSEYQQYEIVELQLNEGDTSQGAEEIHVRAQVHQTESGIVSEQHIEKTVYHEESETIETQVTEIHKEVVVEQGFIKQTEEVIETSEVTIAKGDQRRETNHSSLTASKHHQESSQTQVQQAEHRQESSQSLRQEEQKQQYHQSNHQASFKQQSTQELQQNQQSINQASFKQQSTQEHQHNQQSHQSIQELQQKSEIQKSHTEETGQIQVISETLIEKTEQIVESSENIVQIEKTEITTIETSEQNIAVTNMSYEHTVISHGNHNQIESNSQGLKIESNQQHQQQRSAVEQQVSQKQSFVEQQVSQKQSFVGQQVSQKQSSVQQQVSQQSSVQQQVSQQSSVQQQVSQQSSVHQQVSQQQSSVEQQVSQKQSSVQQQTTHQQSSVEEIAQQKQTFAQFSQKEVVNQHAHSMTHLEQNSIPPMIPESTNNIEDVQIEIAPPKVTHPAQYIDKSGLKFDFVKPPENNPQVEDTTEHLTTEMSQVESSKKVFAQQTNTSESNLTESQTQLVNNNNASALHQSTSISGGLKRYQLGQSITDYKAVIISEQGSQERSATKSTGQQEVIVHKISSPIKTFSSESVTHEVRTVHAQNARTESTNQSSTTYQQQHGSINNSNSKSESIATRTITQDNGINRHDRPDETLTENLIRMTADQKFSNVDLINQSSNFQSNSKVLSKESSQQLPVYINNGNSSVIYQQNSTQSYANQINAFPSQIGNTTSSISYRRINADGRVVISNVAPVINTSANTIRYGTINESSRTIVGDNRVNVTQYSLANNNLFRDVDKSVTIQGRSYQTIPTTYMNNTSSYTPVQYVQTRVVNQGQGQLIQETRTPQSTIQNPQQAYEVIEAEDGSRRYVMKKTTSQAFLSNVSSGVQNQVIIGQPTSMTSQVRYSTNYSVQPQIITSSIGNSQAITNEFKPQLHESESQAKFVKVLNSGRKNVQESQTNTFQSSTYTANSFRPSSTFVNAVIPGFNGQTR